MMTIDELILAAIVAHESTIMFKKAKLKAKIWALAHMIYLIIYLVHNDPDLQRVLEHSNITIGKGVLTINETENDAAEEAAKPTRSIFDDLEEEES